MLDQGSCWERHYAVTPSARHGGTDASEQAHTVGIKRGGGAGSKLSGSPDHRPDCLAASGLAVMQRGLLAQSQ